MEPWRGFLTRLGDRCAEYAGQVEPEDHLETCVAVLTRELDRYDDDVIEVLIQCVEEIPHKQPLYGTLVGLMNIDEPEFVAKVVRKVHSGLQAALETESCNRLRLLLRYLSLLMCNNVIAASSLVEAFEALLSSAAVTVDEDGGNPAWQPRADFYVFCILASLPWCGLELFERASEELERVMAAVEAYFTLRARKAVGSLSPFNVRPNEDELMAGDEEDFVQDLWSRIRALQQAGWKAESVSRPHLSLESRLAHSQTTHPFASLSCPEVAKPLSGTKDIELRRQCFEAECKYPYRTVRLQLFPAEKSEKNLAPIDRFVVEEYLQDIMFYFNGCRKECAGYMAALKVPFRYEFIMAEVVLSQMLLLPKPPYKIIYYSIVVIDLCKALPGAFPAVLAGAVRGLFDRMAELDTECQYRLIQWLAHHLSNFQFIWPWEDWTHALEKPSWSPQRVFVQEVLEKAVRLSYWDRVKQSLDASPKLYDLLPPKNVPSFKFSKDKQVDGHEDEFMLVNDLNAQIKGKKSLKDMQTWIETKLLPAGGQNVAIEVLIQTLLNLGSKSFTHMVTVLERYGQLITKVATDQQLQVLVVEEVANFWQNSSQMVAIVVDRMMGYRLISNLAIAAWVFSEANVENFHTSYRVWEVLHNTISKTINRTNDLWKDIEAAKKTLQDANASAVKADVSRANVQSLIDAAETEDSRRQALARMEWVKTMIEKAEDRQTAAQDLLETKEALLARALTEQETLFIAVFQSFASVVTHKLSKIDNAAMDVDAAENVENENASSEGKKPIGDELKAWLRSTLGQLQSISRQYSTEVWRLMDRLDSEVFTESVNPAVRRALCDAIRRPSS